MKKSKLFLTIVIAALVAAAFGALAACSGGKDKEKPENGVDPAVVSVAADATNAITVYDIGGAPFDPTGVGLVLTYADGSTRLALASPEQITVPELTTRGTKTVTVAYGELTATYEILVRELEELTLDASEATTAFELGSDFSVGGLKVYAKYYDIEERERVKDGAYSTDGHDMTKRGDQTVRVGYLGKSASYGIRVKSRPTELTAASVSAEGGALYITVGGKVAPEAGYAKNELALDIQQLNTDIYSDLAWTDASVGADGAFEIKGRLNAEPELDKAYLVHVLLGGDSYDVATLAEPADNTVGSGGRFYRLKSEKAFGNNETLFAVLRSSTDIKTLASYEVTEVGIVALGDKPYLEIKGRHGNYTQEQIELLQFYFDVQANREAVADGSNDGNRYLVAHSVALELSDDIFTARFELSALGVYKYTVHFRVGEALENDSDNLVCKGKSTFADIGGKRYKLVFDDPVYWGAVGLEVYDASDPDAIYELAFDASRAKKQFMLGEDFDCDGISLTGTTFGGDSFTVGMGGDDGYSVAAPDMTSVGEKTVTVSYRGKTFTYKIEVVADPTTVVGLVAEGFKTDYELGESFTADGIRVYKLMGDGKRTEIAAGGYTLTVPTAADMSTPGKKTLVVKADGLTAEYTVTVWSKPQIGGATIVEREGRLLLEISGTIAGYARPTVTLDLQKLNTNDYIRDLACTPTVDPDTGAFAATLDIGALELDENSAGANVGYMIHVIIDGDSYDLVDIATRADASLGFGGSFYRLSSECCFEDNTSRFVILRKAASENGLASGKLFFHSASIAKSGSGVAVTVGGWFDGVAINDLKLEWRSKTAWNIGIAAETTVNVDGDTFVATAVVPDDDSKIKPGEEVFLWAKLGALDSELRNLPGDAAKTTVQTDGGRYTLELKSLFDEKRLVTVLLERSCTVTSVALAEDGGRAYIVLGGTADGTSRWSPKLDLQYITSDWKTTELAAPNVTAGADGAFTMRQDITEFTFDPSYTYIMHFIPYGTQTDVRDISGFQPSQITVGGKTYKLEARDVFSNGSLFICLTVA